VIAGYSLADLALILGGGVVAGVLNVAAAGGSLVSFLALSATGVPLLTANATNLAATPASFIGTVPTTVRTSREHQHNTIPTVMTLVATVVGTVTGVWLVNSVTTETFRHVAPVLLLIAAASLLAQPWLRPWITRQRARRHTPAEGSRPVVVAGWLFVTSVYAGAWGGGVGVMVLVVFTLTTSWPWAVANSAKNAICLITSAIGVAAFSVTGLVIWPVFAVLAPAMALGGLIGQWLTRRVPEELLRTTVAVVTAFSAGHMAGAT
jgi:uncharacterized membrane protein YfcA